MNWPNMSVSTRKWHPASGLADMKTKSKILISVFNLSTGADSLCYLSVEGLKRAVQYNMKSKNPAQSGHCTACLTGEYPGGLPEELSW